MKRSKGEKIFGVINAILLLIISLITIYPFFYVLIASFSSPDAVMQGKVWFYPVGFEFGAYTEVFKYEGIWIAYANTIYYAVVGTFISVAVTILGAYPLSKKRLRGKAVITFMVAFTMWFNAGMIPTYLNFKDLNLLDTRTALLFGFCCSAFYTFIMRTYFQGIPDSLEESAKIDGANDLQVLTKIYLPLATPCLATIGLYYFVDRWNGFMWAMILLKDNMKIPLQVILKKLLVEANWSKELEFVDIGTYNRETLIYSTIVISIIPVLIAYPYLQKYFVKGIMLGSIKG